MKLTENFKLEEFVLSNTASEQDIDNTPNKQEVKNIETLCEQVLQPLHDSVGKFLGHDNYYIRITSGFRSDKLNKKVGGSPTSFHRLGCAADCELIINGKEENALLFHMAKVTNKVTELIWEYGENDCDRPHENKPAWVHIAYKEDDNRNMVKYIS